jgi:PAS domain S-box-containing protein
MIDIASAFEDCLFGVSVADATAEGMPLVYVNRGFCALTGYAREEVLGRNCRFLQGPLTDPSTVAAVRAAIAAARPLTVPILNYRKDGSAFWNRFQLSPVRDRADRLTGYIGIQFHVTDQTQFFEAERRRARLHAAGIMNSAILHDVANALQPVRLLAEHLQHQLGQAEPEQAELAGYVVSATIDAIAVAKARRADVDQPDQPRETVGLPALLSSVVRHASFIVPAGVRIVADEALISASRFQVPNNRAKLIEVFTNLFDNAVQAMNSKGKIEITVAEAATTADQHRASGSEPELTTGQMVLITIRDTGPGITPSVMSRLFDPFVTSRQDQGGSGLGLAMCAQIIGDLGGDICADNHPDGGAQFMLKLPVALCDSNTL